MPRRVQDIIPANRRSIRDIPTSHRSPVPKREKPLEGSHEKTETEKERQREDGKPIGIRRIPITPPLVKRKRPRFPWIAAVVGVIIVFAGIAFVLSGRFARATFTIVPRSVPVQVNGTYVIPAAAASPSSLAYGVITVTGNASTTVLAALGQNVKTKATGSMTLYNAYSPQSQRLVAGTRLADDSGLIYRLTSSVVIPGYALSGGNIMPGDTVADIVADQPGADYNVSGSAPLSDFRIVAYKGTPKYSAFYARLASDVSGGFVGARTTVSPKTLASTTADIEADLSSSLRDRAADSVPSGYLTYPAAYAQEFSAPEVAPVGSSTARISVSGALYCVIFKASDLASTLAGSSTDSFASSPYDSPGLEALSFSIANPKDFSPAQKSLLVARISGSFMLVGAVPVDALKKAFAGVSLVQTGSILERYASIIDIKDSFGEVAPPWVNTVPSDASRISINVPKP